MRCRTHFLHQQRREICFITPADWMIAALWFSGWQEHDREWIEAPRQIDQESVPTLPWPANLFDDSAPDDFRH